MYSGINNGENNSEDIGVNFSDTDSEEDNSACEANTDYPIPGSSCVKTQEKMSIDENAILDYLSSVYAENMYTLESLDVKFPSEDEEPTSIINPHCFKKSSNIKDKNLFHDGDSKSQYQNKIKILLQTSKTVDIQQQLTNNIKASELSMFSKPVSNNLIQSYLLKNKKPEISSTLNKTLSQRNNKQLCFSNSANHETSTLPLHKPILHNKVKILQESNSLRGGVSSQLSASQSNDIQIQTAKFRKIEVPSQSSILSPQTNFNEIQSTESTKAEGWRWRMNVPQLHIKSKTQKINYGKIVASSHLNASKLHTTAKKTEQKYVKIAPRLSTAVSKLNIQHNEMANCFIAGASSQLTASTQSGIKQTKTPKLLSVGLSPQTSISLSKITDQTHVAKLKTTELPSQSCTSVSQSIATLTEIPKLVVMGLPSQSSISTSQIHVPKCATISVIPHSSTSTSQNNPLQTKSPNLINNASQRVYSLHNGIAQTGVPKLLKKASPQSIIITSQNNTIQTEVPKNYMFAASIQSGIITSQQNQVPKYATVGMIPQSSTSTQNNLTQIEFTSQSNTARNDAPKSKDVEVSAKSSISILQGSEHTQIPEYTRHKISLSNTSTSLSNSTQIEASKLIRVGASPLSSIPTAQMIEQTLLQNHIHVEKSSMSSSSAPEINTTPTKTPKLVNVGAFPPSSISTAKMTEQTMVPKCVCIEKFSMSGTSTLQSNAVPSKIEKLVNVGIPPQSTMSSVQITEQTLVPKKLSFGKSSVSSTSTSQSNVTSTDASKLLNVCFSLQSSMSTVQNTEQTVAQKYASIGKAFLSSKPTSLSISTPTEMPKLVIAEVSAQSNISLAQITDQTVVPKYVRIHKSSESSTSAPQINTTPTALPKLVNVVISPQSSISTEEVTEQILMPKDISIEKCSLSSTSIPQSNEPTETPKFVHVEVSPRASISTEEITEETLEPKYINVGKSSTYISPKCTTQNEIPEHKNDETPLQSSKCTSDTIFKQSDDLVNVANSSQISERTLKRKIGQFKVLKNGKCPLLDSQLMQLKRDAHKHTVLSKNKNTIQVRKKINEKKIAKNFKVKLQKLKKIEIKEEIIQVARVESEKIKFDTLYKLKELDKKDVLFWLMDLGLISSQSKCPVCGQSMKLSKSFNISDNYKWNCRSLSGNAHYIKQSVRLGSIFQFSKSSIQDILMLVHCWIYKVPQEWIISELPSTEKTVAHWARICRNLCTEICAQNSGMIGGDGKVVEIEGKVFEKKKKVEFQWIFTGLEDAHTDKYFFKIVEKCDKQSFLQTIKSAVLPGTTIVSDFCSVYSDLLNDDLIRTKEYSSYKFESLKNTSFKKKSWDFILRQLPKHNITNKFDNYIGEYAWRKRNCVADDKMKKFISDLKLIYPQTAKDKSYFL